MLTIEYLHRRLDYNPVTGVFTWRTGRRPGQRAGNINKIDGYRRIKVGGRHYKASRLVWFYCFNEWPLGMLDHIDRVRDNDRLLNLREATPFANSKNTGYFGNRLRLIPDWVTESL